MALLQVILVPLAALVIYAIAFDLRGRRRRGAPRSHDISTAAAHWLVRTRTPMDASGSPAAILAAGLAPSSDPGRHVQAGPPAGPRGLPRLDLRVVAVTLAIIVYGHATIRRLYLAVHRRSSPAVLRRPGRLRPGPAPFRP